VEILGHARVPTIVYKGRAMAGFDVTWLELVHADPWEEPFEDTYLIDRVVEETDEDLRARGL